MSAREHRPLVTVYRATLDVADTVFAWYESMLDSQERRRAEGFVSPSLRRRFVVGRALLRRVLAHDLGTLPHEIPLHATSTGKPQIPGCTTLGFNLSRSGDLALCGICRAFPIGVDVERVRDLPELEDLIAQQLSARERDAVLGVSAADRLRMFYRIWTRKEAFVKGTGEGLGRALRSFSVALVPSGPVTGEDGVERLAAGWRTHGVDMPPGYEAAIALRGVTDDIELVWWDHDAGAPRN